MDCGPREGVPRWDRDGVSEGGTGGGRNWRSSRELGKKADRRLRFKFAEKMN
jgi:hypothetical protein